MSLVLHAPNVHTGGGRVLLLSLLKALTHEGGARVALLDARMDVPSGLLNRTSVYRVTPRFTDRLAAEWKLTRSVGADDIVLCFGNLPPLFKLSAKVVVFVQNRYLISKGGLQELPVLARTRIRVERLWLALRRSSVDRFIVQTPSMKRAIEENLGGSASVLPFSDHASEYTRHKQADRSESAKYDFLYVASGEPHKNHITLIEAWRLLAQENIRPTLCLTIDQSAFPDLCALIERSKKKHDLRIENRSRVSSDEMRKLYSDTRALVYPSMGESAGLPLIEARCRGLSILAAERDYVRDVIDPEESFDPGSALSIARSVKRFLDIEEKPLPMLDAREFIRALIRQVDSAVGS